MCVCVYVCVCVCVHVSFCLCHEMRKCVNTLSIEQRPTHVESRVPAPAAMSRLPMLRRRRRRRQLSHTTGSIASHCINLLKIAYTFMFKVMEATHYPPFFTFPLNLNLVSHKYEQNSLSKVSTASIIVSHHWVFCCCVYNDEFFTIAFGSSLCDIFRFDCAPL